MTMISETIETVLRIHEAVEPGYGKITPRQLAKKAGLTPGFISQLRRGIRVGRAANGERRHVLPSPKAIAALCAVLDKELGEALLTAYCTDIRVYVRKARDEKAAKKPRSQKKSSVS